MGNARKRKHVERFVSQEDLEVEGETLRIRPDLIFGLEKDGRGRLYLLEADRDTERPVDVAAKLAAYAAYLETPDPDDPERWLWQRYGNSTEFLDFRGLVVGERRGADAASLAGALQGLDTEDAGENAEDVEPEVIRRVASPERYQPPPVAGIRSLAIPKPLSNH